MAAPLKHRDNIKRGQNVCASVPLIQAQTKPMYTEDLYTLKVSNRYSVEMHRFALHILVH